MSACHSSPAGGSTGLFAGKGLGIISADKFKPETWIPHLGDDMGRRRYGKFITAMMGRFYFQESTADEIRAFVSLVSSTKNHDLMLLALPLMPEIQDDRHLDPLNFQKCLWFQQMRNAVRHRTNADARAIERSQRACSQQTGQSLAHNNAYAKGLMEKEKNVLRKMVFTSSQVTKGMQRLFDSWIQLGYPQDGLDRMTQEAKERGTDLERDYLGLPHIILPGNPPFQQLDPACTAAVAAMERMLAKRAEFTPDFTPEATTPAAIVSPDPMGVANPAAAASAVVTPAAVTDSTVSAVVTPAAVTPSTASAATSLTTVSDSSTCDAVAGFATAATPRRRKKGSSC